MNAIGFIELNSIAKGYEVADVALKTSEIQLVSCHAGCPGKFYIMFRGYTSAVEMAMKAAIKISGGACVDSTIISNLHEDVFSATSATTNVGLLGALGVMEFFSVTAAIYAADAAAKAADIKLIEIRTGIGVGGKSYVTMTGSVSAVKSAIEAGIQEKNAKGQLIAQTVIANPDRKLMDSII